MTPRPRFEELPSGGSAVGLWDSDGSRDELGTLNLLTSEVKVAAAKEIQVGISISLNWGLNKPEIPIFNRRKLGHEVIDNSKFSASASFDDTLHFNTQSSSQWDGLRHVVHKESSMLYNKTTKAEVLETNRLGLQVWHDHGCVAGRGVLIDYVAYAARHNIKYSPVEYHAISLEELQRAADEQGLEFREGDILLVRSGVTKWYNECTDIDARNAFFDRPDKASVGVAPTPETIAWVWNTGFAAVAGDALAFEPIPYPSDRPSFHQYLIPLWGTPIGELWDLEKLAEVCAQLKRYSFFMTSVPLNVPGGVASPPNALAMF